MATAVKERPILFSGEMVRAILEGRKTQTRRLVKPQPKKSQVDANGGIFCADDPYLLLTQRCPYGQPGDRLWVRETLTKIPNSEPSNSPHTANYDWCYAADSERVVNPQWHAMAGWSGKKSIPSIHMPRWASRITLEVTAVRVERLQEISEQDAKAEGVGRISTYTNARELFAKLWQSINGPDSWAANPWVWVVEFERV